MSSERRGSRAGATYRVEYTLRGVRVRRASGTVSILGS